MKAELTTSSDELHEFVYDCDLKRPACVLLQAVFGCGASRRVMHLFDSAHWLTAPTPGMKKMAGTLDQWKRVAEITRRANANRT